ncbi:Hypothetical protein BN69_2587 [Methylocystis sp. SC2]|nr:Hypothetical protein BN69_2587 [Methylocystis sp. SC2]
MIGDRLIEAVLSPQPTLTPLDAGGEICDARRAARIATNRSRNCRVSARYAAFRRHGAVLSFQRAPTNAAARCVERNH